MTRDEVAVLAKQNKCPEPKRRIVKLEWCLDGRPFSCEEGGTIAEPFCHPARAVHAILDSGVEDLYKIFHGKPGKLTITYAGPDGFRKPKPTYGTW